MLIVMLIDNSNLLSMRFCGFCTFFFASFLLAHSLRTIPETETHNLNQTMPPAAHRDHIPANSS